MPLSKNIKAGIWIAVSAFLFFIVLVVLRNWHESAYKKENAVAPPEEEKGMIVTLNEKDKDFPLPKYWKFHSGDDTLWAAPGFDDSRWDTVKPSLNLDSIPENKFSGVCWFRFAFYADSLQTGKAMGIDFLHDGASEIYLDGKKIHVFGKPSAKPQEEECFRPQLPFQFMFSQQGKHVFAIRYSNHRFKEYFSKYDEEKAGIRSVSFIPTLASNYVERRSRNNQLIEFILTSLAVFFFTLCLVHLLLFVFYRRQKENLYYSLFVFFYAVTFIAVSIQIYSSSPPLALFLEHYTLIPFLLLFLFLIRFLHILFKPTGAKVTFIVALILCIIPLIYFYTGSYSVKEQINFGFLLSFFMLFACIEFIRSVIEGLVRKRPGSKIVGSGALFFGFFLFSLFVIGMVTGSLQLNLSGGSAIVLIILFFAAVVSIPLSMSIYLARDFALTNKNLAKKLVEVEELSAKSIAQEKEKQEILSRQKDVLEIQVAERTKEITEQKKIIENKNKDITDSINYAKRIQDAILPSELQIKKMFPDSFILFKPKDIVSGDFYFYSPLERGKGCVIAAVDCTGHGVPGAFMSMMGHDLLENIINERRIINTSKILDELHRQVLFALNRDISNRDSKDGMDIAIVSIKPQIPSQKSKENTNTKENLNLGASDLGLWTWDLQFSGAVRPLYYFDKDGFHEVKGDRWSVGGVKEIDGQPFSSATIQLEHPATFYLFSDGFADQFGGKEEKKFMTKRFRELLASIQEQNMDEQKTFLENFFEEWKKDKEQTDDVLVMGVRV